jgi:uncharacterized protein (TIGR00661 family)
MAKSVSFMIEGLGYGHAARMLPVISKIGGSVLSYGQGSEYLRNGNVDVMEIGQPYDIKLGKEGIDVTASIAEIVRRFDPKMIDTAKKAIEGSDLVVIDSSMFGLMISTMLKKKVIFVTNNTDNSVFFPGMQKALVKGLDSFFSSAFSSSSTVAVPDFPLPYAICAKNIRRSLPKKTEFLGPMVDLSSIRRVKNSSVVINLGAGFNAESGIAEVAKRMKDHNFIMRGSMPREGNMIYVENAREFMGGSMLNILHGGHTGIMESIMARKPMVCIPNPRYPERVNNCRAVKELGIGEYLEQSSLNEFSLSMAMEKARRLRRNIDIFYRTGKKMNGIRNLISLIEGSS